MPSYEFFGADPIDHFVLGRVEPGDVVEIGPEEPFDITPPGPWRRTKKRPRRAPSAEQLPPDTEHGSDAPDTPEEV